MANEQNLFPLKMLVISMGVLLLGGAAWVTGALLSKVRGERGVDRACEGGTLDLTERGEILDIYPMAQGKVNILLETEGQMELLRVDPCTGKEAGKLVILGK